VIVLTNVHEHKVVSTEDGPADTRVWDVAAHFAKQLEAL